MDAHAGRISHYRVLGELGRDRLGYVLRAADEQLDRPVVLRVVRAASVYARDHVDSVRTGFQRDAKRAARVTHPNLVTIYAFEAIGDIDLIAMEQVEGASLRAMLGLGDRWRIPEAAKLVARIADAVAAAHAARMAHGRLSLANVIVRHDGRVKVLDLGIPKLPDGGDPSGGNGHAESAPSRTNDARADLLALGLITWELAASAHRPPGALWRPVDLTDELIATVADAAVARTRFGVLGPVLTRALAPMPGEALRDASEFRDAVLTALGEQRTHASEPDDLPLGAGTRLIMPEVGVEPATDLLDEQTPVLHGHTTAASTPRLVLPADLAGRGAQVPSGSTFVVMENVRMRDRWRVATDGVGKGVARRFDAMAPGALIAAAVVLVLLVGGLLAARRFLSSGGASAAIFGQNGPINGAGLPADSVDGGDPRNASGAAPLGVQSGGDVRAESAAPVPPAAEITMADSGSTPDTGGARDPGGATRPVVMRTATVRATSPDSTTIRVRGRDESWTDEADLSVADGDSLIVQFSRPGYVTATRTFKGNRVAVALHPDSVNVRLESNVPAQVYLLGSGARPTQRLLGNTGSTVRLPTGTHRLLFRAPDQADWPTTQRMPEWGETYRVRKTDFVADGTLVVTVPGSWAFVSVDGGPNADTPLRVDRLSVGTHNLRISREGFATINDTVVIRPGQRVTKSYTLRPVS